MSPYYPLLRSLLVIFLSGACTYTPEEEVFQVDVTKILPEGTIDLDQHDPADTIRLYSDANFTYSISADESYHTANISIDNTNVLTTTEKSGYFSIEANSISTGVHTLKISFDAYTRSNSLAGQAGLELGTYSKTWVIVADYSPVEKPELRSSIEKGMLKLSWVGTKKSNFVSYTLMLYNNFRKTNQVIINNQKQTSYYDSAYSGGYNASYVVVTTTTTGETAGDPFGVQEVQSANITYSENDSSAVFSWHRSKYPGAFGSFDVYENDTLRIRITDPNDTTYKLKTKAVFGWDENLGFKAIDRSNNITYSTNTYVSNPTGAKRSYYTKFYYSATLSSMMAYNVRGYLVTVDADLKGIDSVRIGSPFTFPYPGRYVFYPSTNGIAMYDLVTRQESIYTTTDRSGAPLKPSFIAGSNNHVVFYSMIDARIRDEQWAISGSVDMSTLTSLQRKVTSYDPSDHYGDIQRTPYYSDDGRYEVQSTREMYDLSGGTATLIRFLPSTPIQFRPENNDEIISAGVPTKIMGNSASVLRTISPPQDGFLFSNSYDPVTKKLLYYQYSGTNCYLVDIDTGESTLIHAYGGGCIFLGGYLINSNGYYKKIL